MKCSFTRAAASGPKTASLIKEKKLRKANIEYRTRNNEFRSKVFYRFKLI
ncbi:hypothetical protein D1AOALGA4SA_8495 [Olavius algarvensis Delta 1 endosymbiont]|nr:hypothetical protein D1AOALGA4SA_8495 [Olavius algarvensis Delta 1 endosymbiont]